LREKSLELGRGLLEKELRKYDSSLKRVLASNELAVAADDLGFRAVDDLIASVGYGKVPLGQVIGRVVPQEKLKAERPKPSKLNNVINKFRKKPSSAIKIQGIDDIMVRFAKCCNPLPGDPVLGFITRGRGVTVHAIDCPHIHELDSERRIEVEWDRKKKTSRPVKIRVHCVNQKGMLTGITGAITNCEANITSAHVQSTPDDRGINIFEIDVQDLEHLNLVINAIMKIKGVYKVERMRH
jgi:GTP pyrophosphokinase